jgi:photosystem II stability/assembly factor-like uncharacterized protein
MCVRRVNGFIVCLLLLISVFTSCKNSSNQPNPQKENWENEDNVQKLMEQEFDMTKDPATGEVPRERLLIANAYMRSLLPRSAFRTNELTWQERGPSQLGGRTRAILIDKSDATGNTIIAGSVAGGIWRCTNFKTSPVWTNVSDQLPNMAINCLAQDPTNINVMYAGTGEGWLSGDAIRGNGILKSSDGGNTWSLLPSTLATNNSNFEYVQDIVVTTAGIVYAACRSHFCNTGGVQKSTDGGASWTRVIGAPSSVTSCAQAFNFDGADLEIASNGDLYATTGLRDTAANYRGRIWRSPASLGTSQGNVGGWTDITPPGLFIRTEVAVAPNNSNILYALTESATHTIEKIFRSDNAGASWTTVNLPTWCDAGSTSSDFTRKQAGYDLIAQVDPNNSSKCFIGGVDILKTQDAGSSWTQVTQWATGCSNLPQIHADQHQIIFYPGSSSEMIATNDGGIYYSPDGGTTWVNKNSGYRTIQFYSCDYHPTLTNYFLAGSQDNGTHQFTGPGINVTTRVVGGDGAFAHIDQTDGQIQVTATFGTVFIYSRNGGTNFNTIPGGNDSTGRQVNPSDYDDALDVLYAGNNANAYTLVTGFSGPGTPVVNTVSLPALSGTQISAVKIDENVIGTGVVWFAGSTARNAASAVPVLLKVANANTTTPSVNKTITLPFASGSYVSSIDVEKGNSNHLLVTASNYGIVSVYESTDGGTNWVNIEGNLPDMPIRWGIFAPANSHLSGSTTGTGGILLATELGVWTTSVSAGASTVWIPNNSAFVNTRVDMLKLRPSDNLLVAATHGRGLFTTNLDGVVTSVNPVINTTGFIQYVAATKQQLFIKAGNRTGVKNITINLFDLNGKLIYTKAASYTSTIIPISHLSSGSYIVKIYGDKNEVYTQQFVR